MKIYLAGPMRGYKDFNFPAFDKGAAELRALGNEVFSPADEDRKRWGQIPHSEKGDEAKLAAHLGIDPLVLRRQCFAADMEWICKEADAVALLQGWQKSKGATAEHATALALGLVVLRQTTRGYWLPRFIP